MLMAIQDKDVFIIVTVHDGEIELKSPVFGDYLDMYSEGESDGDEKEEEDEEALEKISKPTETRERFLRMALKLIVRWSYPEPITLETIAKLDAKASLTLLTALNELLGVDSDKDKAASKKAVTA